MKKIIRLTENDLYRIVKRVIKESETSKNSTYNYGEDIGSSFTYLIENPSFTSDGSFGPSNSATVTEPDVSSFGLDLTDDYTKLIFDCKAKNKSKENVGGRSGSSPEMSHLHLEYIEEVGRGRGVPSEKIKKYKAVYDDDAVKKLTDYFCTSSKNKSAISNAVAKAVTTAGEKITNIASSNSKLKSEI